MTPSGAVLSVLRLIYPAHVRGISGPTCSGSVNAGMKKNRRAYNFGGGGGTDYKQLKPVVTNVMEKSEIGKGVREWKKLSLR